MKEKKIVRDDILEKELVHQMDLLGISTDGVFIVNKEKNIIAKIELRNLSLINDSL